MIIRLVPALGLIFMQLWIIIMDNRTCFDYWPGKQRPCPPYVCKCFLKPCLIFARAYTTILKSLKDKNNGTAVIL